MRPRLQFLAVGVGTTLFAHLAQAADPPHNLILFVPDGLRALAVTPQSAPTMSAVRDQSVNFASPHSLFPTFTMPNSSGMSTGHKLGDTGIFSNTIYTGYPVGPAADSVTPAKVTGFAVPALM
jgi:Type I phosphodiesterase / nucleotide pyrophosphatase